MTLATLQFYKNESHYPHYSHLFGLTAYGTAMECTPVGMNLRGGTLKVKGTMTDFMSCNYLTFVRDFQTIYAWIDDVKFHTDSSFEVTYAVDAWRTYKDKIDLGTQFVERRPEATSQKDILLGAEQDYPDVSSHVLYNTFSMKRVFVVQVRSGVGTGEIYFSSTPVQPNPYQFYLCEYDVNDWTSAAPIEALLVKLAANAETLNLVTMYSIPYMNLFGLPTQALPVVTASGESTVAGWKFLGSHAAPNELLTIEIPLYFEQDLPTLLRVDHSVQLVVPEAGIIDIPDELLMKTDLKLRQDVDLFSGASNFMLMTGDTEANKQYYTHSIRGSSTSSIPILSDPMDTYLSQNQNALATSLIGDVAMVAGGVAATVGTGGAAGFVGGGAIAGGVSGIIGKVSGLADAGNKYSNPPAFLGSALAGNFNNRCWIVVTQSHVDNANLVHSEYGYQYGKVTALTVPTSGYIKTQGCKVKTIDGTVPRWALDEIDNNFNNGLRVYA